MKSSFVVDLKDGQALTSLFLVREKEIRSSPRTGRSWLQLALSDRTGKIEAKMWDNFEEVAPTFDREDIVKVRGRVKLYNEQMELTIEQLLRAGEQEYDLADFLPHTKRNIEQLFAELRQFVGGVRDPFLSRLLSSMIEDPAIQPKLRRAPAAMTMHHAYIGGLLEHIVSLCALAGSISGHYAELDRDFLIAAAVLHDIGKIDELSYRRAFGYTTEGRLLGHIAIGARMVRSKIDQIPGFPPDLATIIEHMLLSHHGTHEFGSPALPQFCEAVVFHYLDDIDSKMGAMRATLEGCSPADALWSERNPSLRRSLLRVSEFLNGAKPAPSQSAQQPGSAEQTPLFAATTNPERR